MKKPEPRYYSSAARQSLIEKFGWPYQEWMQDWPLEISGKINIQLCVKEYERLIDSDERFLLMQAILYALDGCTEEQDFEYYSAEVSRLVNMDFDLHKFTIYYWTLYEHPEFDVDEFNITPLMRRIWQERSDGI